MKLIFILLLVLSPLVSANVDTATESEKKYLIKIANELAYLQELTRKAKKTADPEARITLDYVALENDLAEIRRALEAHVTAPSRTPRRITSLELAIGNYQ
jgi:RAQPRD family integrative conjugative element protein